MKRTWLVVTIAVAAALFLMGFSPMVLAKPIKVGWVGILTGPGASSGEPVLAGSKLAINEYNEKGGVLERQLELVARDSKGRPDEAVRVSRELILKEKVAYIIGPFTDASTLAVSQVARELETVIMPYTARSMNHLAPENFHPYVFQASANSKYDGVVTARYVHDHPDWKRVFIISPDYEYGQQGAKWFKWELLKRPGVEVVGEAWPKLYETDFGPFITRIIEKKPDVLHVIQWGGDFITLMKQCKTYGVFDIVKGVTSVGECGAPEMFIPLGDAYPEGVYGNSMEVFYYPNTPEHNAYVKGIQKLTGEEYIPGGASSGYIAAQLLVEATKRAGSIKSKKVVAALEDNLTIDTPIGKQTMGKDHQLRRGWFWGVSKSVPQYPFKILDPVKYIPFEEYMVR